MPESPDTPLPRFTASAWADELTGVRSTIRTRPRPDLGIRMAGPWDRIGFAMAMAAGSFPLLVWGFVAVAFFLIAIVVSLVGQQPVDWLSGAISIAGSAIGCLLLGTLLLLYSGLLSVLVVPAVAVAVRMLPTRPSWPTLGTVAACVLTLTGVVPFTMSGQVGVADEEWIVLTILQVLVSLWTMGVAALAGVRNHRQWDRNRKLSRQFSLLDMMRFTLLISCGMAMERIGLQAELPLLIAIGNAVLAWTLARRAIVCLAVRTYYWQAVRHRRWRQRWRMPQLPSDQQTLDLAE